MIPVPGHPTVYAEVLAPSGFGLAVSGIRIAGVPDEDLGELREIWLETGGLLILRGQDDLHPEDFLRLCRAFGPLEKNEKYDRAFLLHGHREILRVGNLVKNGKRRSLFVRVERAGPILWHSDDTFRFPQPAGSALHCIAHPTKGGGTWFAGMAEAYEALPASLRRRIDGRHAVHSYPFLDQRLRETNQHRPPLPHEVLRAHPPVVRPLVTRHPETGRRALLAPECHVAWISGLNEAEARTLLTDLQKHATGKRFRYRLDWRPGDVAIWDNRSVLHAPSPFDESQPRLLHRVTFLGPDPLANDRMSS